jgi:hypothetical protein
MKNLLIVLTLGLISQTSFAVEDEVLKYLNETEQLNLAIPAGSQIESVQIVVADKNLFERDTHDTINNNILFSHGSPMVGFAGMTPYEAVREDGLLYDRDGDGSTVCTKIHQKLINGEINHKDLSDFTCHSVVATAVGATVSNALYSELRDRGMNKGVAKALSYVSFAIAGVGSMVIKEKVYDRNYETADVGTGLVPIYESENGDGLYFIGDLHGRQSVFAVVHFK